MKITKLKLDPAKGITLQWEQETAAGEPETYSLTSKDAPSQDLYDALQALAPVVASACMIDVDGTYTDYEDLTVRGVTVRYSSDHTSVVITALRRLDWIETPLVLNTPLAPVQMIPGHDVPRLLEKLLDEAEAYIEGKRAQANLFDPARELVDMGVTFTRGAEA
ncbi:MAG: hypothetical protein KatS3mg051_2202 [Anaerolineae bacterium]|nr:MAG: hypothetical protein KatS3mg051_2202 [Anaerolineae bacterium]